MTLEEFALAVQKSHSTAVAYASRLVGDHAEDAFQDTIYELLSNKKYQKYRSTGAASFATWFRKCLRFNCLEYLRAIRLHRDLEARDGAMPHDTRLMEAKEEEGLPHFQGLGAWSWPGNTTSNNSQRVPVVELEKRAHSSEALYQIEYDTDAQLTRTFKQEQEGGGEAYERREVCVCRKLGLTRALQDLTFEQHRVVVLTYKFEYTQAEIASQLGVTPRTVQVCLEKAKTVLLKNSAHHDLRQYL